MGAHTHCVRACMCVYVCVCVCVCVLCVVCVPILEYASAAAEDFAVTVEQERDWPSPSCMM